MSSSSSSPRPLPPVWDDDEGGANENRNFRSQRPTSISPSSSSSGASGPWWSGLTLSGGTMNKTRADSYNHLRRRSSADHTDRRGSRRRSSRRESELEGGYRRRESREPDGGLGGSTLPSMSNCTLCVRTMLVMYILVMAIFLFSVWNGKAREKIAKVEVEGSGT